MGVWGSGRVGEGQIEGRFKMAFARSVKELEVWLTAMNLAMDVFAKSKGFPADEKYSLTDQIRRSSRSVAANISEAWRKRRYPASFVSKLSDAETEAGETQTWIEFARRCGYWKDEEAGTLEDRYEKVIGQLVKMIDQPEKWCGGLK
jgi:four helix bundle protein